MTTAAITGDTRLSSITTVSSYNEQTGTAYLYLEPLFVWEDYQAESVNELIDWLRDPEFFSNDPTLYEALALIFHAIQQLGGSLRFLGRVIYVLSLRDCGGLIPLQDDTIVIYNGAFFRLGHLLQEYNRKGANPELFEPNVSSDEAKEYVEPWERPRF